MNKIYLILSALFALNLGCPLEDVGPDSGPECSVDADCGSNMICSENECQNVTIVSCSSDDQCRGDQMCVDAKCFRIPRLPKGDSIIECNCNYLELGVSEVMPEPLCESGSSIFGLCGKCCKKDSEDKCIHQSWSITCR